MFQDREGHEIALQRWGALREDDSYRIVAHDQVISPAGEHELKTMWHGLADESIADGLFSTGYTEPQLGQWWTLAEYDTEQQARDGHAAFVAQVRSEGRPAQVPGGPV